jgi:hypothetical protein
LKKLKSLNNIILKKTKLWVIPNSKYFNCIDPYFVGIDDDLCTLVEACAKSENEFRCKECIEFYCLDKNKEICIENDKIENETYKIYYACNYTNEEGTRCEQ